MTQIVQLCTTEEGATQSTCIQQDQGLIIWGPTAGTSAEGLALVLGAYMAGFLVASIKKVFFHE